jgi:hypothetical protein
LQQEFETMRDRVAAARTTVRLKHAG